MRIFDFHVHAFPEPLAKRAVASLAATAGPWGYAPHTDGTGACARALLTRAGIGGALLLGVATKPGQVEKVDDFGLSAAEDGFFRAAGGFHPDMEDPGRELDRLRARGVRGIKIHPDYAGCDLDDPRYDRIFGEAAARGFFVVTHTGFDPVSPERVHASPEAMLTVIRRHPDLVLVAAHLGGRTRAAETAEKLAGRRIWFDTSLLSLRADEADAVRTILREHDPTKILFGTDTPWTDPADEVRALCAAVPDEKKRERIFYQNAAAILGL